MSHSKMQHTRRKKQKTQKTLARLAKSAKKLAQPSVNEVAASAPKSA